MNRYPDKILVMEGNEDSRSSMCDFLENLGYFTAEAKSAATAVEIALVEFPDLIFIDLSDNKALEVIYKLRQKKELTGIPILVSSADGGFGIELYSNIEKFGKGFIGYLTKPVSFNDLADQVSSILLLQKRAA